MLVPINRNLPSTPNFFELYKEKLAFYSSSDFDPILNGSKRYAFEGIFNSGGAVMFPHIAIDDCINQVAEVVNGLIRSYKSRILIIGVLHSKTDQMKQARERVECDGVNPIHEPLRSIQGPNFSGEAWKEEHSLLLFKHLLEHAIQTQLADPTSCYSRPEIIECYPFLVGDSPESMPEYEMLKQIAKDSRTAIVFTGDQFHLGPVYNNSTCDITECNENGISVAQKIIQSGFNLLADRNYTEFIRYSRDSASDFGSVGVLTRSLFDTPCSIKIYEMNASNMAPIYDCPPPCWVAGTLARLVPH